MFGFIKSAIQSAVARSTDSMRKEGEENARNLIRQIDAELRQGEDEFFVFRRYLFTPATKLRNKTICGGYIIDEAYVEMSTLINLSRHYGKDYELEEQANWNQVVNDIITAKVDSEG